MIVCQNILQQNLKSQPYNTIDSFIHFYDDYKQSKYSTFIQFISTYRARLFTNSLSCVGLTIFLLYQLRAQFKKCRKAFALVSCEEVIDNIDNYDLQAPNVHKSHVMVALKIILSTTRKGVILFDPGYHVNKPIVVMEDKMYPHTSNFFDTKTNHCVREFNYEVIDDRYILWSVKEKKNQEIKKWVNLIYVYQAFESFINVTEKRSLLYHFKSFVIRDGKGPKAGMYFNISKPVVTIFKSKGEKKKQIKLDINEWNEDFCSSIIELDAFRVDDCALINQNHLFYMLKKIRIMLNDKNFVSQLLEIDRSLEDRSFSQ